MLRVVIENLILFLLPTIVYVAFVLLRRRGKPDQSPQRVLDDAPIVWLIALGALTMMAGLAFFVKTNGGSPGQGYEPPVFRDGKIVPGRRE
jgi:hypothetical protein